MGVLDIYIYITSPRTKGRSCRPANAANCTFEVQHFGPLNKRYTHYATENSEFHRRRIKILLNENKQTQNPKPKEPKKYKQWKQAFGMHADKNNKNKANTKYTQKSKHKEDQRSEIGIKKRNIGKYNSKLTWNFA